MATVRRVAFDSRLYAATPVVVLVLSGPSNNVALGAGLGRLWWRCWPVPATTSLSVGVVVRLLPGLASLSVRVLAGCGVVVARTRQQRRCRRGPWPIAVVLLPAPSNNVALGAGLGRLWWRCWPVPATTSPSAGAFARVLPGPASLSVRAFGDCGGVAGRSQQQRRSRCGPLADCGGVAARTQQQRRSRRGSGPAGTRTNAALPRPVDDHHRRSWGWAHKKAGRCKQRPALSS